MGVVVMVGGAAVAAGWWLLASSPAAAARARLRALGPGPVAGARRKSGRALPIPLVAVLGGLGVAVIMGGPLGAALGVVVAIAVRRGVPRLESRAARTRRVALAAQAPELLDLLAACLAAGATVQSALHATAEALDPPARELLRRVDAELRLGADPERAWEAVAAEPALAPLAAAVRRSADSGAALADALAQTADDLRARRRSEVEAAARKVGVRLTAPLGLAFLPAFVLLGVVPVVASLVSGVLTLP